MGQQNSKDELVHQQVIEGNIDAIKALSTQGARLEWIDQKGKTPLIVASMDPRLYIVAKNLIELGANISAYRPGRHAGTPLHHAAKRGLDDTVKLLISHGASPFTRNDDCQTPLDVARAKGHSNVVRAIEVHISYFSGDMREILAVPGIFEQFVPQRLSRKRSKKCWVVVVPCSLPNPSKPPKLELAVYNSPQDPQPRTVIALWKCHIAEPKFNESDPALVIIEESTGTRHKFLSAIEGDQQQLSQLYSACKGFPEVTPPLLQSHVATSPSLNEPSGNIHPVIPPSTNSQSSLALDSTNGWVDISGSATTHNKQGSTSRPPTSKASTSGWTDQSSLALDSTNGWGDTSGCATIHNEQGSTSRPPTSKASTSGWTDQPATKEHNGWGPIPDITIPTPSQPMSSAPSAPPIPGDILDMGAIQYPVIDSSPVDLAGAVPQQKTEDGSCVICWDAPVEGACVPCGHMAGCMSCLTEIRANKGDCPVCRAKIDQVIRVYAV